MTPTQALALARPLLAEDRAALIECHAWPAGSGKIPAHDEAASTALARYDAAIAAIDALPAQQAAPVGAPEVLEASRVLLLLVDALRAALSAPAPAPAEPVAELFKRIDHAIANFNNPGAFDPELLAEARKTLASLGKAAPAAPAGWTDADADAARLALELECLLTDKDIPTATVSRWWDSAHEALRLHRERLAAAPGAPQGDV